MKKKKQKRVGCDNCGEAKEVKGHRGGRKANWDKILLCNNCKI